MKQFIITIAVLCSPILVLSQNISGLWKGTLFNDSTSQSLPYELFIKKEKNKYTGYSHSWFLIDGKEYYGIRKVKITIANDGKIVIKDGELIENNYPVVPDRRISQLNVLDLVDANNEKTLAGIFVTNSTKQYRELTGKINIQRVNSFTESSLLLYLQKKEAKNEVATIR